MRCGPSGSVWVDSAMDLDAMKNRTWSSLRHGDHFMDPSIKAEFKIHGEEAFTYEVLEKLDDDVMPMALRDLLKERKLYWTAQLSARKIWPA